MSSSVHDLYAKQVTALSDAEKLQLVELIAHELAASNGGRSAGNDEQQEFMRVRFRRHAGSVSLGHATGARNDLIDADLGDQYGGNSEQR